MGEKMTRKNVIASQEQAGAMLTSNKYNDETTTKKVVLDFGVTLFVDDPAPRSGSRPLVEAAFSSPTTRAGKRPSAP